MTRGYANREERREYESVSRKVIPANAPFAARPGICATLRAMKCLPALALPLLLSACASDVSPEDRDFFYHGWKNPEQSSRERMNGRGQANYFKPDDTARVSPNRLAPLPVDLDRIRKPARLAEPAARKRYAGLLLRLDRGRESKPFGPHFDLETRERGAVRNAARILEQPVAELLEHLRRRHLGPRRECNEHARPQD